MIPCVRRDAAKLIEGDAIESLVLSAAREYFNAASSMTDPSLDCVAECLRVLPQESAAVDTELRLLEGVRVLASYGCTLLPLQVRLHQDRPQIVIDLVEAGVASAAAGEGGDEPIEAHACDSKRTVSGQRMLSTLPLETVEHLAECLGFAGQEACDRVNESIALSALRSGDVSRALSLTKRLVSTGYVCTTACR